MSCCDKKSIKLVPRSLQKTTLKSTLQLGSIFKQTWLHFWEFLGDKMGPSWLQNRSKLECWFETCFLKVVGSIFTQFLSQHNMAEGTIPSALPSRNELFCFLVVVLLGCFFDWFWVDFWWILGSKIDQKLSKNQSKRRSKTRCKLVWIFYCSWRDVGTIWGASWEPS